MMADGNVSQLLALAAGKGDKAEWARAIAAAMPSKKNAPSVFVRGLGPEVTNESLAVWASTVAPVTRAFVVKDTVTRTSRGFGFVQFAFEDDARACVERLNSTQLGGRTVTVDVAAAVKPSHAPGAKGPGPKAAGLAGPKGERKDGGSAAAGSERSARGSEVKPSDTARDRTSGAVDADATAAASAGAAAAVGAGSSAGKPAKVPRRERASADGSAEKNAAGFPDSHTTPHTSSGPHARDATVAAAAPTSDAAGRKRRRAESTERTAKPFVSVRVSPLDRHMGGRTLGEQQTALVLFGLPVDFPTSRLWKRVRKTQPLSAGMGSAKSTEGGEEASDGEKSSDSESDAEAPDSHHSKAAGRGGKPEADAPGKPTEGGKLAGMRWPVKFSGSEQRPVAIVRYAKKAKRDAAVRKLDGHSFHGHTLYAVAAENVLTASQARVSGRLIVRNLAFNCTAAQIRAALVACKAPASFTHIHVPSKAGPAGGEGEDAAEAVAGNRGFAFIEFAVKSHAEAAIKLLNEHKIAKRVVAVDWAVSKEEFEKSATVASEAPTDAAAVDEGDSDASSVKSAADGEEAAQDDAEDRMSVDDSEHGEADEDSNSDRDSEDEPNDAEQDEDGEMEDEAMNDDEEDEDASSTDASEDEAGAASVTSSKGAAVEAGTTIFVRNLPFDASENDVFELMKQFGPVRYARIVMNHETGMSKGTAFVQFYHKESADRVLAAANASDAHSTEFAKGDAESTDARQRKAADAAAAVAAALQDGGIKLKGRVLFVLRAVGKDEATRLVGKPGEGSTGKKYDKRHTYLSHEGNIRPDGEAASHMPKSDLEKRQSAQREKKTKLKSPLFFVSPCRLSVRNLSKNVDDATLRDVARRAALAGWKDGLVDRNEGDPALRLPVGVNPRIHIAKAKIIRESLVAATSTRDARIRLEADGVTPRSRGFGFVEFTHHAHALACLRKLNNNPEYSEFAVGGHAARTKPVDERPRLIVEFTIENWREVKKQERKQAHRDALRTATAAGELPARETKSAPEKTKDAAENSKAAARAGEKRTRGAAADAASAKPARSSLKSSHKTDAAAAADAPAVRKRVRVVEPHQTLDRGIAAALAHSDGDAGGSAGQSRRGARRQRARAEDVEHDRLVADYQKKLFGSAGSADAMRAWM